MQTARIRLAGFVCYVLVTMLLPAAKTSAQSTNTNCSLVMTCPSNIVVTSCFNVQEFYTPTASNICCGVNSTVACSPPSGSIFTVGTTTTVICTATDCAQNTNFCTFTVTVLQGTNCATNCLQIQCPSNIVVTSCTNLQEFYAPTVTDSCCSNWTVVCTPASGSYFAPNTTNLVICTATDFCGLSNDCSFVLVVLQGTNCPTNCLQVECPTNKTIPCGTTNWSFDPPTATSCCTNLIGSSGVLTNVVITSLRIETNGTCPQVITQTWSIVDGCGNSNTCSQIVTVACCATNCIDLICPSDILVTTCSNCATVFYTATATNGCCFSNVVLSYSMPSGTCFPLGTNVVQVTAYDPDCASTPPTMCSFTVTVVQDTNCCGNLCCGPGAGPQTINWLQLPTNGATLVPNSSGSNGAGTWIVTNLPGYGNVLVTQDPVTNVEVLFTKDTPFDNTPNTNGLFEFTETGYGPYSWGTLPGWVDLYYNRVGTVPNYNVSFYFLDGPPSPCDLVLAVIADAQYTTNIVSQPVTFRTEYDLTNSFGQYLSAFTTLNGAYGLNLVPGVNGDIVGSAYSSNGIGSDFNTGFALFQLDGAVLMTNLPPGSGMDLNGNSYPTPGTNVPYVTFTISHQAGDSFGLTVGYIYCPPCPTNCLQVECPTNKTVECGSTWSFDPPTATSCCTNEYLSSTGPATNVLITPTSTVNNGACPQPITITQTWSITDPCGDSNTCSQTVTVIGCCTNPCSGPGLGLQSIQWLQLPTNTTRLLPDPSGANTGGTWIITNLPGYGNVLVTQAAPTNIIARCTNSDFGRVHAGSSFDNVPSSSGYFYFTETNYGPYTWGVLPGSVELAYEFPYFSGTGNAPLPSYTVSFYFLDGQPNPGTLVLATIGLAQFTTNTLSQPFTFRTEYDLLQDPVNYPQGPSADTVLDGTYGPLMVPGVTGTVISSAYGSNGGDDYNTGYAIFQPANNLRTTTLPSGSGFDVNLNPYPSPTNPCPYITVTVNSQEIGDIFSLAVGYLCCTNCPTNCLQMQGSTNKTVPCSTNWAFDPPTATSCCTNEFVTGPATETNVLITVINTVTNGACPEPMQITRTWSITDGCGDSNTWSQTVTVVGCCTNCLQVNCPTNKTVACGSAWMFDTPTATTCCTNPIDAEGGVTNVLITPISTQTNGSCPQVAITQTWSIVDACGNSNTCSQVVTLIGCCTNCLTVTCPTNKTVQCCSNWSFDLPTATTCCTGELGGGTTGPGTNILITPLSTLTNGTCPEVTITQTWLITDACVGSNTCSQVVTVLGCCTNQCCGPNVGSETIQWLQCPAPNSTPLLTDPSGSNTTGTWIITNLPCYGNVLITQTFPDNSPDLTYWFLNPNLQNVPAAYGSFADVQAGYGPYLWGTYGSLLDFYNGTNAPITYNLNFYFLGNAPNPCTLYLGVVGLAADTTATVSQPVVFRAEYDLVANAPGGNGNASANTTLDGVFGPPVAGAIGTVVGSAYNTNGVGDPSNTGWAVLQPTNALNMVNLPGGSGTDINGNAYPAPGTYPCLTLTVNQESGDGIAFTVGYVCCNNCPTNCLQVQCPTNKTIPCGTTNWSFDPPIATSCCTNEYDGGPANPPTNVLITPFSTVTNGACPQPVTVTQTWLITDLCGDSTTCTQIVTLECCATNCIDLNCPSNIVVTTCSNCAPVFYSATGINNCCTNILMFSYNPPSGYCFPIGTNTVQVSAFSCGFVTNCEFTVTVLACTNCLQVECPSNKTVQCDSTWTFDAPTATTCCASNVAGTKTNLLITITSTMTNGVCPKVITRTWSIIDGCGDSSTCSQTVTVVDTTPPVITCPTNAVVVLLNSNCQFVIPNISVTATDNCTPVCSLVYTQSPTNGTVVSGTNATVTVTVTDLCGNSNSCHVLVVAEDKISPVLTCLATMMVTNCTVPCVPATATANCCPQAPTITQFPSCNTPMGPGINIVTVTATDCHGNTASKTVHLIVTGPTSFLSNLTNTGVGAGGILLADDIVDPNYLLPVAAVPAGMPADYNGNAVAVSDICHSTGTGCAWSNNYVSAICFEYVPWNLAPDPAHTTAVSKWIAPDYTNNGCCPTGNFTYTLNFILPAGLNPATATISGRWAADNQASMQLNGVPVPGAVPYISAWTPFTIPPGSGFVTGANTLKFTVNNYGSWTGLRVEFTNAYANCATCAPPVINGITPAQSLQAGSTATFSVTAGGTPPLSYQWFHNSASLAGDTNATLQIHGINYPDAGLYSVVVSNPCGVATGSVRLNVTQPWSWQWGWWNVQALTNPLAATTGPALNLVGSSFATNYGINAGTTEDFGLPAQGGQIVNVMDINPQAAASIEVPLIAASGTTADDSYTVVMDIYEPDTSLGTPSTLFQSIACCVSNLGSGGQDGVGLTLDVSNNLHITGSASGVPFDAASAAPLPVDAWNRVALVVDNPQDGGSVTISGYLNGTNVIVINPCICCVVHFTASTIDWTVSPPTLFSVQTNANGPNGEFYVSSVQFHDIALGSEMLAGIGSPDNGPAPGNQTSVGAPPALTATLSNGVVNITWSGNAYILQETTDLRSGVWTDSTLPFTEVIDQGGNVVTTGGAPLTTTAPSKFYRLIFSP